jgi:hypothetical protein
MCHNISDDIIEAEDQVYFDKENKICFVNNAEIYSTEFRNNINTKSYENIIRSYEDSDFSDQDGSFVILRDFLNLVCSRYKLYHKQLGYTKRYCTGIENLIALWKKHSTSKKAILYNQWILSKSYRDEVGRMIEILNLKDNFEYVSRIGNGSSFGGVKLYRAEDYLKRYEKIKLPKDIVEVILADEELAHINKDLFDIEIKNIRFYLNLSRFFSRILETFFGKIL